MWEEAYTFQRYPTSIPLDHGLRISLYTERGGSGIAYAEFFVQADARGQAYFDNHPTFAKDVWPDRLRGAVTAIYARSILDRVRSVHCYIFEKWSFLKHLLRNHAEARRVQDTPCNLLWKELISNPHYAAQAALLAKSTERAVIDLSFELIRSGSTGTVIHDRKHISWMNRALENGFRTGREISIRLAVARAAKAPGAEAEASGLSNTTESG